MDSRIFEIKTADRRRIVRAGVRPWQGLGMALDPAWVSASRPTEIAESLGWTWSVEVRPAHVVFDDGSTGSNGAIQGIVRTDTRAVFGWGGRRWQPLQPAAIFDAAQRLSPLGIQWERAGCVADGMVLWLMGRVDDEVQLGDDRLAKYAFLIVTNDGHTTPVALAPLWLVEQSAATLLTLAGPDIRLFSSGSAERNHHLAEAVVMATERSFQESEVILDAARRVAEFNPTRLFERSVAALGGHAYSKRIQHAAIEQLHQAGLGQGTRCPLWAALHAVLDSADHLVTPHDQIADDDAQRERHLLDVLVGLRARMKRAALQWVKDYLDP